MEANVQNTQKSGLELLKEAINTAKNIVTNLTAGEAAKPDVIEARRVELKAMTKDDLIAKIIELEAPKAEKGLSVVDIIKAICTEPACQPLNYEQVAVMCKLAIPDAKTTGKSVASVACKQGGELGFLPRVRVKLDVAEMLS